jgi:hypothetical protein
LVCPDKLLKKDLPPFLLLLGGNTYPILTHDNENFKELLKTMKVRCELRTIPSQSHMQMIYLFEDPNNSIYKEVMNWMNG